MGKIFEFILKSVEVGGDRKGNYNISNGNITHPPKGTKGPKVKTKMVVRKKEGK